MARPKLPRKSTSVDMTAMCDVAFLLLSFFILTTKFKASETVAVITPSSVSSKVAPEKDVTLVNFTKDGKVFLSLDNQIVKEEMAIRSNLLEHVAQRIITRTFKEIPSISQVILEVSKLNPPIGGDVEAVTIEMDKTRS